VNNGGVHLWRERGYSRTSPIKRVPENIDRQPPLAKGYIETTTSSKTKICCSIFNLRIQKEENWTAIILI